MKNFCKIKYWSISSNIILLNIFSQFFHLYEKWKKKIRFLLYRNQNLTSFQYSFQDHSSDGSKITRRYRDHYSEQLYILTRVDTRKICYSKKKTWRHITSHWYCYIRQRHIMMTWCKTWYWRKLHVTHLYLM